MIIRTNQKVALTVAQPQPSASNRPKKARRRGAAIGRGVGAVVSAIAQLPTASVPVMFACTVHTYVYAPAGSAWTS